MVVLEGTIEFDAAKPDGTPRKLLDTSRLEAMGRTPRVGLRKGIESTYLGCRERDEKD